MIEGKKRKELGYECENLRNKEMRKNEEREYMDGR